MGVNGGDEPHLAPTDGEGSPAVEPRATKSLVVTVGGSPDPIVTAIETLRPDHCVFVCTEQTRQHVDGVVTKVSQTLTGLTHESVVLDDPDDPDAVLRRCSQEIERLAPSGQVLVDYTGGTKSMSAGLLLAAVLDDADIYVTSAPRRNDTAVDHGQATSPVAATASLYLLRKTVVPQLVQHHDYAQAHAVVLSILAKSLPGAERRALQHLQQLLCGFAHWDRFDHDAAKQALKPCKGDLQDRGLWDFLGNSARERIKLADTSRDPQQGGSDDSMGWLVADLIRNAERRAKGQRFDDAVGRLYRALELWAQILLRSRHGIDTASVDLTDVYERAPQLREELSGRASPTKLGLVDSWRVLLALDPSPEVQRFDGCRGDVLKVLEVRNHSLFAHGFTPIRREEWDEADRIVAGFLRDSLAVAGLPETRWPQLPAVPDWFWSVAEKL